MRSDWERVRRHTEEQMRALVAPTATNDQDLAAVNAVGRQLVVTSKWTRAGSDLIPWA